MSQDRERLNILAIFHFIFAFFLIASAAIFFYQIHVAKKYMGNMNQSLVESSQGPDRETVTQALDDPILDIISKIQLGVCLCLSVFAVMVLITGLQIRRCRARVLCLLVGGVMCLIVPLGTILGVFTLVMLTRGSTKKLFLS